MLAFIGGAFGLAGVSRLLAHFHVIDADSLVPTTFFGVGMILTLLYLIYITDREMR